MPITRDGIIVPKAKASPASPTKKRQTRKSFAPIKPSRPNISRGVSQSFSVANGRYTHPDYDDDPTDDPFVQADIVLTKNVAAVIELHYPGHPWFIEASHAQGVVMIAIPIFMGTTKWIIHINTLKTDPGMRCVIRAAGEILERYQIPRQRFSPDHFMAALNRVPIHRRGRNGFIPT